MAVIPKLDSSKKMRIEDCPPYITRARENRSSSEELGRIYEDMKQPYHTRYWLDDTTLSGNKWSYKIDELIKAVVPDHSFRTTQTDFWKSERNWYLGVSLLSGIVTACGFVEAVKKRANQPVAVAITVASLAGTILTTYTLFRGKDASNQVKGWEQHPCGKIANDRLKALTLGFSYVKKNNLKLIDPSNHAILLEEEVEYLYDSHFKSRCQLLLDQPAPVGDAAQHQWLNDFTCDNPVARDVLEYAYRRVPDQFVQVSSDYEALHAQLSHLRDQFTQIRTQRQQETQNIIDGIEQNRELALAPFNLIYNSYIQDARQERDRKLSHAKEEDKAQIEREYQQQVQKYDNYLMMASAPLNIYFDGQVAKARNELKTILVQIDRNESAAHAPYYNYSKGLLEYARKLKTQPDVHYVQPPLPQNFYDINEVQQPSAPPAADVFEQKAAENAQGMSMGEYREYLEFIHKK